MRLDKRSITLLEILLVMVLVGFTLGVIATQAPKAFKGGTFERGVDQIKTRIALAQELMLSYQTDVTLTLVPEKKGMWCYLETAKPLPSKLKRPVNRQAFIKGIEEACFDGVSANEIVLSFDGTLGTTSKGRLLLKGGNREAILTLKGFPSYIQRGDIYVAEETEAIYPEAIFSLI